METILHICIALLGAICLIYIWKLGKQSRKRFGTKKAWRLFFVSLFWLVGEYFFLTHVVFTKDFLASLLSIQTIRMDVYTELVKTLGLCVLANGFACYMTCWCVVNQKMLSWLHILYPAFWHMAAIYSVYMAWVFYYSRHPQEIFMLLL